MTKYSWLLYFLLGICHWLMFNMFFWTIFDIFTPAVGGELIYFKTLKNFYSMQRCLSSPVKFSSPINNKLLRSPINWEPQLSTFFIFSVPHLLSFCLLICLSKNQLTQSEDKIYCHNSLITLLTCPMCFILSIYY